MKNWQRTAVKAIAGVAGLAALVVGYLWATHKPGLTVFIENAERRGLLEQCLRVAEVQFEVTDRGAFRAKPGSIQRMETLWRQFDEYRAPTLEFCREQKNKTSSY